MGSERRQLRRTGQTWFLAACWGTFGLIGLAVLASPSERYPFSIALYGAMLVGSTVLIVRTLRAEIRIEDAEVLLRGLVRTRRVQWTDVARAEVIRGNGNGFTYLVVVHLRDGKLVRVDGIANFTVRGDPQALPVAELAEAINARVGS